MNTNEQKNTTRNQLCNRITRMTVLVCDRNTYMNMKKSEICDLYEKLHEIQNLIESKEKQYTEIQNEKDILAAQRAQYEKILANYEREKHNNLKKCPSRENELVEAVCDVIEQCEPTNNRDNDIMTQLLVELDYLDKSELMPVTRAHAEMLLVDNNELL